MSSLLLTSLAKLSVFSLINLLLVDNEPGVLGRKLTSTHEIFSSLVIEP